MTFPRATLRLCRKCSAVVAMPDRGVALLNTSDLWLRHKSGEGLGGGLAVGQAATAVRSGRSQDIEIASLPDS